MQSYKFSGDEDLITFVHQYSDLFKAEETLQVEEIGDGNINFVYRVSNEQGVSVIVKQGLPYVRIIGEGWPLSQDRVRIEAEALQLEAKYAPGLVPEVYAFDAERFAILMEDIGSFDNLRQLLVTRTKLATLADDLATFLAKTLFYTSELYLDSHERKKQLAGFINPDLCKITEDLFFWDPFCDHERNAINPLIREDAAKLWNNPTLKLEVAKLKRSFLCDGQALLHGDLHSGSVFASQEGTKVIDPEFAYVGPIGFDVGSIIGNLLLNYVAQFNQEGDEAERAEYRHWLLEQVKTIWLGFSTQFDALMAQETKEVTLQGAEYRQWYLQQIFADSLGYAGTEMIRRTIGLAHVADLESIEDEGKRAESERLALQIGERLILQRSVVSDVEQLVNMI